MRRRGKLESERRCEGNESYLYFCFVSGEEKLRWQGGADQSRACGRKVKRLGLQRDD